MSRVGVVLWHTAFQSLYEILHQRIMSFRIDKMCIGMPCAGDGLTIRLFSSRCNSPAVFKRRNIVQFTMNDK